MKTTIIILATILIPFMGISQLGCGPTGTYFYYPSINQTNVSIFTEIWFLPETNLPHHEGDDCWNEGTIILSGNINIHQKLDNTIIQKIDINDFYLYGEKTYQDTLKFALSESLDYSTSYYITKEANTLTHCQCGEEWFDYNDHLTNDNNWFHWTPEFSEYLWEFTTEEEPGLKVNENFIDKINVYPNPSSNIVLIEADFDEAIIYDQKGKLVFKTSEKKMNITNLPNGVYMVNIKQEGVLRSRTRFIKK